MLKGEEQVDGCSRTPPPEVGVKIARLEGTEDLPDPRYQTAGSAGAGNEQQVAMLGLNDG